MKVPRITILAFVLILALIAVGYWTLTSSFYKKICRQAVPFQKKLDDFYGSFDSDFGHYDNIDQCIEELSKKEEQLYEECYNIKNDKEQCHEIINKERDYLVKIYTKEGCKEKYGVNCSVYELNDEAKNYLSLEELLEVENEYQECIRETEELCRDLPDKLKK